MKNRDTASRCVRYVKNGILLAILFVVVPANAVAQEGAQPSIRPGTNIQYNKGVPQLHFAAMEIQKAFNETKKIDLTVELKIGPNGSSSPEGFEFIRDGQKVTVIGTDPSGAMYGGLEVAEYLKLGLDIKPVTRSPFLKKRGIKFNIPLDARSPSYDDGGDSANLNVKNMWDFEGFWKPYIDDLARYRYNVLSLWTRHPFPHMVDLSEKYPTINPDNKHVYRVKDGVIDYKSKGKTIVQMLDVDNSNFKNPDPDKWKCKYQEGMLDPDGDGFVNMDLIQKVDGQDGLPEFDTIEKKIAYWNKVFDYAEDRGLEIIMIYWNVFTPGAVGHHPVGKPDEKITQDQTNDATIDYIRYAVKEFILTYPQVTSIGVIAGEHDIEKNWVGPYAGQEAEYNTEHFVYKTYGLGLKDALAEQPGRDVKFIWRAHSMDSENLKRDFTSKFDPDNSGKVLGSIKYTIGRLHSSRTIGEQEWQKRADKFLKDKTYDYKIWLNLRNDDLFMHRWGSPDYVYEFIKNMPHEHIPGFYMGSDGYVWGKDYFTKTPGLKGQMEIKKHWYNFKLWGELAYHHELDDAYWQATLKHRFGLTQVNTEKLYHAWEQISEVVPEIIRNHWVGNDAGLSIEGCQVCFANATGFLPITKFYYNEPSDVLFFYRYKPMKLGKNPASMELPSQWVPDWGKAYMDHHKNLPDDPKILTPLRVADRLDRYAKAVDDVIGDLQSGHVATEFQELLWDLQSMAQLGRYYADKTRCAAKYWVARESKFSSGYEKEYNEAVQHIEDAEKHWIEYARILDLHYTPQVLSRTHNLDWNKTLYTKPIEGPLSIQNVKDETKAINNKRY